LRVFSKGFGNGTKVGQTTPLMYDDELGDYDIFLALMVLSAKRILLYFSFFYRESDGNEISK